LCAAAIFIGLPGCAGYHAKLPDTTGGCGGVLAGATVTIQYPERSRDPLSLTSLSSALSSKLVITGASSPGGTDVTIDMNRDASKLAAHSEVYNLPRLATGTFTSTLTLYSNVNQTGTVVGTVTASDTVSCSGHSFTNITLAAKAASIAVTPMTLSVGDPATQLEFSVKDASNAVIPVTPGSAIFNGTGAAATITKDGLITPVSAGTIQVSATVDGLTSPATTVAVKAVSPLSYRVVDLGIVNPVSQGKALNDNGLALVYSADGTQTIVVNISTLATTPIGPKFNIGAINNADLVVGYSGSNSFYYQGPAYTPNNFSGTNRVYTANDLGNCVGATTGLEALYWDSPTAVSALLGSVGGDPTHWVQPTGINASKVICGNAFYLTQFEACYFPSPSTGQATLLPQLGTGRSAAQSINDSGAIVGYADSGSGEYAVIWDTPTSAARSLGSLGTAGNAEAFGINNAGSIVGADENAPTSSKAFVYTAAKGMQNLFDLCDGTRTGWQLQLASCINNHGWIYGQGVLGAAPHVFVAIPNP